MTKVEHIAEGVTLEEAKKLTRTQRWRLRKRGVAVPFVPQKSGFTQAPDHVAKRKRTGADHYAWQGPETSKKNGRKRALKMYPPASCEVCGALRAERHHKDENTSNNEPSNIEFLCRPCHLIAHGKRPANA